MRIKNISQVISNAIAGDNYAMQLIIEEYHPLIKKHSVINGRFCEDCMQFIMLRVIEETRKFKIQ